MSESVYTPEYRALLQLLVSARHQAGITQQDLATRLNRTKSYISKIEAGHLRLDVYQLYCYLSAIEIDFLDFMKQYDAKLKLLK